MGRFKDDAPFFRALFSALAIGPNKQRNLTELTLDVSRRTGIPSRALWDRAPLQTLLHERALSPRDRYQALIRTLEQWKMGGRSDRPPRIPNPAPPAERHTVNPEALAPKRIYVDPAVSRLPRTQEILRRFSHVPQEERADFAEIVSDLSLSEGKRTWVLTAHRGKIVKPCPGMTERYLCCNYFTFDLVSHCPLECSYCILQSYLKQKPAIYIYTNLEEILAGLEDTLRQSPTRHFRIGTGEVADSLALDPLLGMNAVLIEFFARQANAVLELKTKSDFVDHLLPLDPQGRTVIAWSMNPPEIIATEEWKTASLDARLAASRRAASAGYRIAFHIDPIIVDPLALEASLAPYYRLIESIENHSPLSALAWISLGTLRFPHDLKEQAEARFPRTQIYTAPAVKEGHKFHYPVEIRERVLGALWKRLATRIPKEKLYLCMETPALWAKIDPSCRDNAGLEHRLAEVVEV